MDLKKLISGEKKDQSGKSPGHRQTAHFSAGTDALWAIIRRQRSELIELRAIVSVLKRDVARLDKYFYANKERIMGGNGDDLAKADALVKGGLPPGPGPVLPGLGEETLDALPLF